MKWKMHENSLFAVLLRSPWWVSWLIALGIAGGLRLFLPIEFALFGALPFFIIGCVALWRFLRRPGAKRVAATLERARGMSREEFGAALAEGFRRQGYAPIPAEAGADLALTQNGRVTLVACRRWKAGRTGIEPLKEFDAATRERGAIRLYVAVGEVTDNARVFASQNNIRIVQDEELATLLK